MGPWVERETGGEVAEEPVGFKERPLHVEGA